MTPNRRILCVDDEPRILEALGRTLGDRFEVLPAESGDEALQILTCEGPFAVIVSDMRMPRMDGAEFLARAQKLAPDAARILLTGNSELHAAIDAVNRGGIFRFLFKPCEPEILERALEAGIEHHRLILAERELLEQTLAGTINMLSDLLAALAPDLFAQAARLRDAVTYMVKRLGLVDAWQYEVAATLSQIGLVALPPELVERALAGRRLSQAERKSLNDHPSLGYKLVANIPRLDRVAGMIRDQRRPLSTEIAPVVLGASLIQIATELDALLGQPMTFPEAYAALGKSSCDPKILTALADYRPPPRHTARVRAVGIADLRPGMILHEDVRSRSGTVVLAKGHTVTAVLIERILRFALTVEIAEPFHVKVAD